MTDKVEVSAAGVSGPQHLLIPGSYPSRHPYAIPTDISLTLPPLAMSGAANFWKATSNARGFSSSGVPSPPSSDCDQSYSARKESSSQESFAPPRTGPYTPPYSGPGSWTPPASQAMTSSQTFPEPTAYDMAYSNLALRPGAQRQFQQQTYYNTQYGTTIMPAPSSLMGQQIVPAPSTMPTRALSTYHSLPPPVTSGPLDYSTGYAPNYHLATGHVLMPSFTFQPSPYPQLSLPPQTWPQPLQIYRPEPTIFGFLPERAWKRIFEYLHYADRLRLQSVNRFFGNSLKLLDERIKANPSSADFADMHSLVLEAENFRRHWPGVAPERRQNRGRPRTGTRNAPRPPETSEDDEGDIKGTSSSDGIVGNLGCFHCFKVLSPAKFCLHMDRCDLNVHKQKDEDNNNKSDTKDWEPTVPCPRRYCFDCGIEKGYHKPNEYYERKTGGPGTEVWICCLKYHKHGVMNCPTCGRGCPLTPVNRPSRRNTKRSSPMPPPSSRSSKQQRTSGSSQQGQAHSSRYSQAYQNHYDNAQWS